MVRVRAGWALASAAGESRTISSTVRDGSSQSQTNPGQVPAARRLLQGPLPYGHAYGSIVYHKLDPPTVLNELLVRPARGETVFYVRVRGAYQVGVRQAHSLNSLISM